MRHAAFTLIELMLVLTIIGLLTAFAVPKYIDLSNHAKIAVCKGTLANVRAAILLRSYESGSSGVDAWPALQEVQDNDNNTGSSIMQNGDFPDNPFSTDTDRDAIVETTQRPQPSDTSGAWAYNTQTGEFWANTAGGNNEANY